MRLGTVGEVVINEIAVAAFLGFTNYGRPMAELADFRNVPLAKSRSAKPSSARILKALVMLNFAAQRVTLLPSFPPNTPQPLRAECYFFSLFYLFNGLLPVLLASTCCASLFENVAAVLPPAAVAPGQASLLFRMHHQMHRLPQNAELLVLRLGSSSGEAMLLPLKKRTREWYGLLLHSGKAFRTIIERLTSFTGPQRLLPPG